MSKTAALGEFRLIERLAATLAQRYHFLPGSPDLLVAIGDDAAVWTPTPGMRVVATTDALVEGVHFRLEYTSWRDLGWKALAANVSDAAAMAASPRFALVTLGISPGLPASAFEELYIGMAEHGERYGVQVVGGDIVSSPVLFLNVALYAEVGDAILRRDAARPGDLVAVTGTLGDAAGGLRLLEAGQAQASPAAARLVEAHNRPQPRVAEAQVVAQSGIRCGMDLSDGLLGDATRLADASQTSVELWLDRLPLSSALREIFGSLAPEIALAGGEDYELLVAGPERQLANASARLADEAGIRLTVVGRVLPRGAEGHAAIVLDGQGKPFEPRLRSWEHSL